MSTSEEAKRKNVVDRMKSSAATEMTEKKGTESSPRDTKEMLHTAIRISEGSHESGEASLAALTQQGETMKRATAKVDEAHDRLMFSKRHLRDIRYAICKEKFIKGGILATLVLINFLIIYVRWIRK